VSVVEEYLLEARKAGFEVVRVIHGRGKGIQRAAVQRMLSEHEAVDSFWDDTGAHLGATMVRLKKPLPPG
jgi:dsDNA-specific endonuclease/ATPase MutS2